MTESAAYQRERKEELMKPENISPELKEKLRNAKSMEELREIAAEASCAFSDEELKEVVGGEGPYICVRDWSCSEKTIDSGPPSI